MVRDQFGIGGTFNNSVTQGKLFFAAGNPEEGLFTGKSNLTLRTWHHIVLVRGPERVRVYLNGNKSPEIDTRIPGAQMPKLQALTLGGGSDRSYSFEGKMAKVAVFNRLLSAEEIVAHYRAGSGL